MGAGSQTLRFFGRAAISLATRYLKKCFKNYFTSLPCFVAQAALELALWPGLATNLSSFCLSLLSATVNSYMSP